MGTFRRTAGLGLLVYGIGTVAALMAIGSPGGDYSGRDVAAYVSSGHRVAAFALAYLGAFAAVGLLVFAHRMRDELGAAGRIVWGLAVAGTATAVAGWFVVGGVAVAAAEGGTAVASVPHPVIYLFTQIGNLVAVCGGAFFTGLIALVLAARGPLPTPLRIASAVAGVCGIAAPFYFPMVVFWLWVLVVGIWAVVSTAPRTQRTPAQTELV
jgi:hypothetical protein